MGVTLSAQEIEELKRYVMHGGPWVPLILDSGRGSTVRDIDGKEYIDCTSQAWSLNVGFCNEEVVEAAFAQARRLTHARPAYHSIPRLLLAKRLAELAPGSLNRVAFSLGGSLSVESSMKLALINRPQAHKFIVLFHAYHGTSFATMAASWFGTKTPGEFGPGAKFLPFMNNFVRVPNPYCYRCYFDLTFPRCNLECAQMLRHTIQKGVDGPVAAVLVEPLQGNGGQIEFPAEYLRAIRRICDETGTLLIFDEIQTAFGRVGMMFAAQLYGVTPDMIVVSKALGGGFPLGAVIADERLTPFEASGEDAYTYGCHLTSIAAALKNLEIIERDRLPERAAAMGAHIKKGLFAMQKDFPEMGEIRGPGLHIGVELVSDPTSKEPAVTQAAAVFREALGMGVIFGLGHGQKNVIKIKPPLVITEPEADRVLEVLAKAMANVFRRKAAGGAV